MDLYIASLTDVRDTLGIGDELDDPGLTLWMEGLQGRFDGHCKRIFEFGAGVRELFDGGCTSLFVKRWPITAVSQIVIDGDQEWGESNSLLDADDYLVNTKRGSIIYGRGSNPWPAGRQAIQVTYDGGFFNSDTSIVEGVEESERAAVRRAFFMQIGFEWRNRKTLGITQISQSGASQQMGAGVALALKGKTLLPEVEETLMPFVRTI